MCKVQIRSSLSSFARVFQVLRAQLWPNPFLLDRGWVANRRRLVWKTRRWFAGVRLYQRNLPSLLDLSWSNIWRFAVYDGIFFKSRKRNHRISGDSHCLICRSSLISEKPTLLSAGYLAICRFEELQFLMEKICLITETTEQAVTLCVLKQNPRKFLTNL